MPLKISANGRYFTDGNGRPVFWLGDTQWELFRLMTPEDASIVLRDRQAKGFNAILIMLLGVNMTQFGGKDQVPYANFEGETPWLNGDPDTPNEKYFRQVDRNMGLGAETGQTFVVGVYHQWHVDTITVPKARRWARWVAERYRSVPDLVWCMYPKADPAFIPVCRELAAGLREGDGGTHLIGVHPDPSVASSSFMHVEDWLAFNMIQTCVDYDRIHEAVTADYARTPAKPVVMAEGGYEGLEFEKLQTAHHIRKQAWWTHLAGGFHVYGHNDAWMHPNDRGKWLNAPGSVHLKTFREIATSLPGWENLVPDQSILSSGAGTGYALNAAARSSAGDWALVYLSEPGRIAIRPNVVKAGGRIHASWIDPVTGERKPAGKYGSGDSPFFSLAAGREDALLLLEAR
jgi:hypothetical protein